MSEINQGDTFTTLELMTDKLVAEIMFYVNTAPHKINRPDMHAAAASDPVLSLSNGAAKFEPRPL